MKMPRPSIHLSQHHVARTVLFCCIPLAIITYQNTPQPPSRRILGYYLVHDQENLDRELLLAVFQKDSRAAKRALICGANPNVAVDIPQEFTTCLSFASKGFTEKLGGPWHVEPPGRFSPLRMTLNHFRDSYKTATPLNVAVFDDNSAMIHLLLNQGAKVNFPTDSACSPLMVAAIESSDKPKEMILVNFLLKHGGKFSTKPCTVLRLPLTYLAAEKNQALLRLLLEQGFDPNQRARAWQNPTPLMWAAYRNPSNIPLLLSFGADDTLRDNDGKTAYHWAKSGDDSKESLRLLGKDK
jgi:hypothetical protein